MLRFCARTYFDSHHLGAKPEFESLFRYSEVVRLHFFLTKLWRIVIINNVIKYAGVAQLVERVICNLEVAGSIPVASSRKNSCSFEQEFFQLYWPFGE